MKTKQKSLLTIILVGVICYAAGAIFAFPFSQLGLTSGNIGKANKQSETLTSPSDVKLQERFEKDTAYCHQMLLCYTTMAVQAQATVSNLQSLKQQTAGISDLKDYGKKMDNAIEVGKSLETVLTETVDGLNSLAAGKSVNELSLNLSKSFNLFVLLNSQLSTLNEFSNKTMALYRQKKINDSFLKLFANYLIQSADIATFCGDNYGTKENKALLSSLPANYNKSTTTYDAALKGTKMNSSDMNEIKRYLKGSEKLGGVHDPGTIFDKRSSNQLNGISAFDDKGLLDNICP